MQTLVQAKLLDKSALDIEVDRLRAFGLQLQGVFGGQSHFDKAQEYYAIRNNSPVDYCFGNKGKKGLQSLMNKLIDQLGIDGIYPEVFASFAMHLGAENLQRLYADLCLGAIDCSDMAATMQRLEKEQGDLGKLTQEHRDKVSEANTGRKLTQEPRTS